jgi:hypothetical protein
MMLVLLVGCVLLLLLVVAGVSLFEGEGGAFPVFCVFWLVRFCVEVGVWGVVFGEGGGPPLLSHFDRQSYRMYTTKKQQQSKPSCTWAVFYLLAGLAAACCSCRASSRSFTKCAVARMHA